MAIDSQRHRVAITGDKFGIAAPEVWLGAHRLEVVDWSEEKMLAKLPVKLTPATYKLSVRKPRSAQEAPSLFVQIP